MGLWKLAGELADKTPDKRNRYVDFLRGVSILFVISGHWILATAYYQDGVLSQSAILEIQPQTQWLTWLFQVMPIFFIVGGYANGVSIESAKRRGVDYANWLSSRLFRLITPLLLLIVVWALLAFVMRWFGVSHAVIEYASKAALIPIWFLSIYTVIALLAPLAYRLWKRWGLVSFFALVTLAIVMDLVYFLADVHWPGWTNYLWVWLAMHQLGFAWRDERLGSPKRLLFYSVAGLVTLMLLVFYGPYPLAMVGSPDEAISNTLPPKITLIALGIFQFGLLLAFEKPMRKILLNKTLWTATVLINSMIMTVYLWHITILVIVVALSYLVGGFGLTLEPGSTIWWFTRPIWIGVLLIGLIPVSLLLSSLERRTRPESAKVPSATRLIIGALMACLGVALLAAFGYGSETKWAYSLAATLLVLTGAGICGLLPGMGRKNLP